jgi:hypothetical protein
MGDIVPAGADYFDRTAGGMERGEVTAYFIGAISDRVARVTISPREGAESTARINEPPEELGVQYSFFVGFAPSGTDVTVSVENASGAELARDLREPLKPPVVRPSAVFQQGLRGRGQGTALALSSLAGSSPIPFPGPRDHLPTGSWPFRVWAV